MSLLANIMQYAPERKSRTLVEESDELNDPCYTIMEKSKDSSMD